MTDYVMPETAFSLTSLWRCRCRVLAEDDVLSKRRRLEESVTFRATSFVALL